MIWVVPRDVLTLRQLNRATLARQMLLARSRTSVLNATQQLLALQAQIARPPVVGLWSRIDGLKREDVVKALVDKRLVRGTSLRGTLHVMTASDFVRFRSTLQNLRVLRDEETILAARAAAEKLLDADPELADHELLRAAVLDLEDSAEGEFIEKS